MEDADQSGHHPIHQHQICRDYWYGVSSQFCLISLQSAIRKNSFFKVWRVILNPSLLLDVRHSYPMCDKFTEWMVSLESWDYLIYSLDIFSKMVVAGNSIICPPGKWPQNNLDRLGFNCLRIWGISSNSLFLTLLVGALSFFDPAINMVEMSFTIRYDPFTDVSYSITSFTLWDTWGSPLAPEWSSGQLTLLRRINSKHPSWHNSNCANSSPVVRLAALLLYIEDP